MNQNSSSLEEIFTVTAKNRNLQLYDAVAFGSLQQEKGPNIMRISTHNPNGIKFAQFNEMIEYSRNRDIDVQSYTEINIDLRPYRQSEQFRQIVRSQDPIARTVTSTSFVSSPTSYKPGGTSLITFGNNTGRIKHQGDDEYGRWCYTYYSGVQDKTLLIIAIYVCQKPTNTTGRAAWHQQEAMFIQQNRPDTHPGRNFVSDLSQFLTQATNQYSGLEIIIMGDMNQTLSTNSPLKTVFDRFNLTDLWFSKYSDDKNIRTYNRGSTRIDYIVGTPKVRAAVEGIQYEEFYSRLCGDHRAVTADIDIQKLLGNKTHVLGALQPRFIRSRDPCLVIQYIDTVHDHCTKHNLFERLEALASSDELNAKEIESIDKQITRACQAGEKNVSRRRSEFFTIKKNVLRRELSLLRRWCRLRKNGLPTGALNKKMDELGLQYSDDIVKSRMDQIKKELGEQDGKETQQREQELLAKSRKSTTAAKDARAVTKILSMEQRQAAYKMYKVIQHQRRESTGINQLKVPMCWPSTNQPDNLSVALQDPKSIDISDSTLWQTVSNPKEIEKYLLMRNQRHFGQAHGTPFTTQQFTTRFNWTGDSSSVEAVLRGQFLEEELDDIATMFLKHCQQPPDLEDQPYPVTMKQFEGKISSWRENTSTSPSGRHLGHYKSLFARLDPGFDEKTKEYYEKKQGELAEMYLNMINYALKHKYSFERWKDVTNVMIYKVPGNTFIHRLRVIHIFEADLNLMYCVKWREALHAADKHNRLNPCQFGGRPGKQAATLTAMEEWRYEYAFATRTSFAQMDNDASSCYDRIVPSLSSLVGRSLGINKNVTAVHGKILKETRFTLQTAAGLSSKHYSHSSSTPIYGTGQGSGNSPYIWLFISSILFDCHEQQAHGAKFTSSDGDTSVYYSIVGFVDDSTCCVNNHGVDSGDINKLIQRLKHDTQVWHDLLWFSGGKLELPKCSYHLVAFDFDRDGTPTLIQKSFQPIQVQDNVGQTIGIRHNGLTDAHKTLGHYKAPYDHDKNNFLYIMRQGIELRDALARSPASNREAKLFYDMYIIPSLGYTLAQSCLTDRHHQQLNRKILPTILSKCGYNRSTNRDIIFGPAWYGGAGFIPLRTYDGVGKCMMALKFLRSPHTREGQLLRIVLSRVQYQSGFSKSILEDVGRYMGHVERRWISTLREFLQSIDGTIQLWKPTIPPKLRSDDIAIMDMVTDHMHPHLTTTEVRRINQCRLYLGVTWMSELTDTTGVYICKDYLNGYRPKYGFRTSFPTIRQRRPSKQTWTVFSKFIRRFANSKLRLANPLGPWVAKPSDGNWGGYLHRDDLYIRTNGEWTVYKKSKRPGYRYFSRRQWTPTPHSIPVTTYQQSQRRFIISRSEIDLPPADQQYEDTFHEFLATKIPNAHHIIGTISFCSEINDLQQWLTTKGNDIYLVSDGSDVERCMSFGWSIGTPSGTRFVTSHGPVDGHGTSHRAEAGGMLGGAMFLTMYLQYFDLPSPRVHIFSDNLSLIRSCQSRATYGDPYCNTTLKTDFDLLEQIYHHTRRFQSTFDHVAGHQDSHKKYENLKVEAQMNVDADKLANEYQKKDKQYRPKVSPSEICPAMIHIRGATITGRFKKILQRAAMEPPFIQYLCNRYKWDPTTVRLISWDSVPLILRTFGGAQPQTTVVKLIGDILPTNAWLYKIKQRDSWSCPLCGAKETTHHIFQCPHESRITWRRAMMKDLRSFLNKTSKENDSLLSTTFLDSINQWMRQDQVNLSDFPEKYHQAIQDQTRIGWMGVFRGHLAKSWAVDHESSPNRSDEDPSTWLAGLGTQLLTHAIGLWIQRNRDQHGHDESQRSQLLRTTYTAEIRDWAEQRQNILPCHQHILPKDVDNFCDNRNITQLQAWLLQYRPALKRSLQEAKRSSLANQPPISRFFSCVGNPQDPSQSSKPAVKTTRLEDRRLLQQPIQSFLQRSAIANSLPTPFRIRD